MPPLSEHDEPARGQRRQNNSSCARPLDSSSSGGHGARPRTPAARIPDEAEELTQVRRRNPSWVIVRNEDGTYTGRRDWWGSQQVMTLSTLAELDAVLQTLNHGPAGPRVSDAPGTAEGQPT
jgi:hypothetical protein